MTIDVKVKVYSGANWDAAVIARDRVWDEKTQRLVEPPIHRESLLNMVKPGEEYSVSGTDTREIVVREVKHPTQPKPA